MANISTFRFWIIDIEPAWIPPTAQPMGLTKQDLLTNIVEFLNRTQARDKLCRTIQYA